MKEGSIFVVGSFVAACSIRVERLPAPGETLRGHDFVLEAGGKGFNIAACARKLGADVDGVLAVGSDLFGDFAASAVASAGLPETMLHRVPGPTGTGVGFVDAKGENCIAVCPAANDLLGADTIASAGQGVADARFVVAQFEVGDDPIRAAFGFAKRHGGTCVLNPSPYRAISPDILGMADMIVVNLTEAEALAIDLGLDPHAMGFAWRDLADAVFASGVHTLVVTFGADGASAWTATQPTLVQPAFSVPAIDTIGAGDAFLGALLAGLWNDRGLAESLRDAAACGALVASRSGVLQSLPDQDELRAFLRDRQTRS